MSLNAVAEVARQSLFPTSVEMPILAQEQPRRHGAFQRLLRPALDIGVSGRCLSPTVKEQESAEYSL